MVKGFEILYPWHWNQKVTPVIAYFSFNIALFVPSRWVTKGRLKPVVLHKADKTVRKVSFPVLEYFTDDGAGVVKPEPSGHAADVVKDRDQALK